MSIQAHSRIARALTDTARACDLRPFDVRVLVTLEELGGQVTSDRLQEELHVIDGSNMRRSLVILRSTGLLSGGESRGHRQPLVLLEPGRDVVRVFRGLLLEVVDGS